MNETPIPPHQRTAREILARWRRNRPKTVADAVSGATAAELVEMIEGALTSAAQQHDEATGTVRSALQEEIHGLRQRVGELETELRSERERAQRLSGALKPGAKKEAERPKCERCQDTGFEVFNMEVIPCRKCIGESK